MRVKLGRFFFVAAWASQWEVLGAAAQVTLLNLRVNPPVGIDLNPHFSWTLSCPESAIIQTSYQIFISRYQAGASDVWRSGPVPSKKSRLIKYAGPPLSPHTHYFWTVQLETTAGSAAASTDFVTGILSSDTNVRSQDLLIERRQANDALARSFQSATWIWTSEAAPPIAPSEDRVFRRTYSPPTGKSATSADILITVDNLYSLYVNGKLVGSPGDGGEFGWATAQQYHVSLGSGSSVFAVRGTNLPNIHTGADSPAGLLVAIQITHSDGSTAMFTSDNSWRANKVIPSNFAAPSFDDSSWASASPLGKYGSGPWNSNVVLPAVVNTPSLPTSIPSSLSQSPAPSNVPSTRALAASPSQSSTTATPANSSNPSSGSTNPGVASIPTSTISPGSPTSAAVTTISASASYQATSKPSAVGPIVGGVIGGLVILALLLFIFLCRKRLFTRRPSQAEAPFTELSTEPFSIQPFTLLAPAGDRSGGSSSLTGQRKPLYPVGKNSSKPSAVSGQTSSNHDDGFVSVIHTNSGGVGSSRVQRLQDLASELTTALAERGEGNAYVAELRGRIAELMREDSKRGSTAIPPPYYPRRED